MASSKAITLPLVAVSVLASCGPKYSPPDAPATACRAISEAAFHAAKGDGATVAKATIRKNGTVSMDAGAGVKHCSSFKGGKQICRRPNDLVIQYTLANGSDIYVMVPKNREYRLTIQAKPIPCEVIDQ